MIEVGDIQLEAIITPDNSSFSCWVEVFANGERCDAATYVNIVTGEGRRLKRAGSGGFAMVLGDGEPRFAEETIEVEIVRLRRDALDYARNDFGEMAATVGHFAKVQLQS